jgi:hypothetical protein
MAESQRRDVSSILEQRRRELRDRSDISDRMRQLSSSGGRHPNSPKRARRPALLTGIVAASALAAMLLCAVTAIAVVANGLWFHSQLDSPATTAQNFYGALHQEDFSGAYAYLSSAARSKVSQADFTQKFEAYDQVSGVVETYLVKSSAVHTSTATVIMDVTRSGMSGQAVEETLNFVKQNDGWRIDTTNPSLWT